MNTRRILWVMVLALAFCSTTAMAVNTVVIPPQNPAPGATGVVIPVLLTNDVSLKSVIMPLALREVTAGAFVTSLAMDFGDRLPTGGPLAEVAFRNQYAEEDGTCGPGGFGTISFNDGLSHPVAASPEGVLFARTKLFSPSLAPGADVTGSFLLTVDVTAVDGTFEIDTTCADPANRLLFGDENNLSVPIDFTKGEITIGTGGGGNTDPDALCQDVTVDANGSCVADANIDNGSSDPDGDPITLTQDPPGPYSLGATVVTLTVEDDQGGSATCQGTVTVVDNTDPVITACAGDVTVCPGNVPVADIGLVTATDNCGAVTITHEGDATDGASCPETITRTYRATDGAGNFVECTQTITVNDTEAPAITVCAPAISVECEADVPSPDIGLITATDNCGTPTIAWDGDTPLSPDACGGTITRTYSAEDACGNRVTCTQIITVDDTTPPTLTCAGQVDLTVDANCEVLLSDLSSSILTLNDNCSDLGNITVSQLPAAGAVLTVGTTVVTITAIDECGNESTCDIDVVVTDVTPPSITCPTNISVPEDAPGAGAVVTFADPTFGDNCPSATLAQIAGLASGSAFPLGTTTNTFEVTDAAGLTAQCSFDVTVTEGIPPLIALCQDVTVDADANCQADVTPAQVDNGSSGSNISLALDPLGPYGLGSNAVELVVTDDQGGEERCSATITVEDNAPPSITCPADITVDNDPGQCGAIVDFTTIFDDNCPGASLVCTPPSGSFFAVGTATVTCVVTDAAGNTNSCSFDVTVNDAMPPTISCPADIVVSNDPGQCGAIVDYTTSFDDNCSGATLACDPASGSFFDVGLTSVTCTVTDAAGNTATCSFNVTVNDMMPPTISCPANISVAEDAPGAGAVVTFADPTFGDNCPGATLAQTAGLASGSTFPVGTTTNTFLVTDATGNTAQCSFDVTVTEGTPTLIAVCQDVTVDANANCQADVLPEQVDNGSSGSNISLALDPVGPYGLGPNSVELVVTDDQGGEARCPATITVEDNAPPSITCPADITVDNDAGQCGAIVDFTTTFDDNCPGATLDCVPASGTFFDVGVTTVTCTATDAAGNTGTCSFSVTVNDVEPPIATCPADIVVDNDPGICGAFVDYTSSVTDNCPGATIECFAPSGSRFPIGTTQVTCTATDASGNTSTCSFDVTVNDVEPPVANCPGDITVGADPGQSGAIVNYSSSASDNCEGATIDCTPASGSFFPLGPTTVTCTATDASGNTAICDFVVTVEEGNVPPVALCADITVDADANCEADASIDNGSSDPDGDPITLTQNPAGPYPLGATLVTLTVEDDRGGVSTCDATVTVVDVTPPVVTCSADMNVIAPFGSGGIEVDYVTVATDNCPGVTLDCVPASGSFFSTGTTTVTCTATDAAGNTATCAFDVTVEEEVEPPALRIGFAVNPGSCPAPFNANQDFKGNKGVFPVVVFGAGDFDVNDIDFSTVELEGIELIRYNFGDFGTPPFNGTPDCPCASDESDGIEDAKLKFSRFDLIDALGTVSKGDELQIELTGELLDGTPFFGFDCIRIVGNTASVDGDIATTAGGLTTSNYPNPFNAGTTISYQIDTPGQVNVTIYNILGQNVATLADGYHDAGTYTVEWQGRNSNGASVSTGMYFYRVRAGELSETRKMLLIK